MGEPLPPFDQAASPADVPRLAQADRQGGGSDAGYSPFVPLLLVTFVAVVWAAFQCYQLVNEKDALATVFGNQIRQHENATKLRTSLDTIARETKLLAEQGNGGAKLIVDELARRGVSISTTPPPSAAGKDAK